MNGRFWLGIAVLAIFLLLGVGIWLLMPRFYTPICSLLEQARSADFSQGLSLTRQAYEKWQQLWGFTASITDHSPMDEIDGLFAQAIGTVDAEELAPLCSQIARRIHRLTRAQQLSWWNFL